MRTSSAILLTCCFFAGSATAQGFKFPNATDAQNAAAAEQAQREASLRGMLATPCREKIRNRKIMVLIAEERSGMVATNQGAYSPHLEAINTRLEAVGLKTYTAEQIRKQIAQAEIDAYFKNNPDAALSASRRLGAQYVLRGVIASRAEPNAMINVNNVSVSMDFTLSESSGKRLSIAGARNDSYAGSDTAGMALTLIEERADEVVAKLYSDYCRSAAQK